MSADRLWPLDEARERGAERAVRLTDAARD